MSVLFLDHLEADMLSAQLYLGLCEILGPSEVVDYPYKRSYHGGSDTYPSVYDRDPGRLPWQHWWRSDQGPMGHTSPFAWFRAQPGREWSKEEVLRRVNEFGLAILASPRQYNSTALADLMTATDRLPPLVMVDGEDYEDIRYDFIEKFNPRVYFKRECLPSPKETWVTEKRRLKTLPPIVPFPFASTIPLQSAIPKDIDVLFLGGATSTKRAEVCEALRRDLGSRFEGGIQGHVDHSKYLDMIARAKIAISVRGHGYDTLRHWEIVSFDTMLLADRLPLRRPHPFEDGVHAAYFDSTEDLLRKVRHYLEHDDERVRVARAGTEHLRQHHTARARAQQLLDSSPRR